MGIEVKGTNCKLWVKEHDGQNGPWRSYTIGVSKKDMDGNWAKAYQEASFTKNVEGVDKVPNGTVFDFEGWMSVRVGRDRDGKVVNRPIVMVNKAKFEYNEDFDAGDSYEQLEEDVPFN